MTELIAVVDYGMGNLRSVAKALEHAGGEAVKVNVTSDPKVVRDASRVVFPGQGAMGDLSLIHISEPTRRYAISYAVFC